MNDCQKKGCPIPYKYAVVCSKCSRIISEFNPRAMVEENEDLKKKLEASKVSYDGLMSVCKIKDKQIRQMRRVIEVGS